jgi:hypothetical protein
MDGHPEQVAAGSVRRTCIIPSLVWSILHAWKALKPSHGWEAVGVSEEHASCVP